MLYDVFVVSFMTLGIAGLAFYSYRISRSRVYPVGIVRDGRASAAKAAHTFVPTRAQSLAAEYLILSENMRSQNRGQLPDIDRKRLNLMVHRSLSAFNEGTEWVSSSGPSFPRYAELSVGYGEGSWYCPKCGLLQKLEKDVRCRRCAYALESKLAKQPSKAEEMSSEQGRPEVLNQIAKHGQALQELEKRIRQLEKESVLQGIRDARPVSGRQPAKMVN